MRMSTDRSIFLDCWALIGIGIGIVIDSIIHIDQFHLYSISN